MLRAIAVLLAVAPAAAQDKPGVALPTPVTLGARAGRAARVHLPGELRGRPLGVWSSVPAAAAFWPAAGGTTMLVHVPPGTPVGLYPLRLVTTAGVSDVRPLSIDDRPEVTAAAGVDAPVKAQPVPARCVIIGEVAAEARAYFRVPVTAGVPVLVEAFARRVGSPLDPVVTLLDPAGKPLPGLYADDTPGLQGDARVGFTPAADGHVIAEVRDATYKGGPGHGFRLRVGPDPAAMTAFPFAAQWGTRPRVTFTGPEAADIPAVEIGTEKFWRFDDIVSQRRTGAVAAAVRRGEGVGWPVPVRVTEEPQATETEPNDTPAAAQVVPVPGGVSARFGAPNDRDHFRFALKKGETVTVTARTAEVLSPCEVLFRVLDPAGKEVAKSDPQKTTAAATVTAAAAGEYVVACEHLNYLHGPTEVYWLTLDRVQPGVKVTLTDPRVIVPAGGVGLLRGVVVTRTGGLTRPVVGRLVGSGGAGGSVRVPEGVSGPVVLPVSAHQNSPVGPSTGEVTVEDVHGSGAADVSRGPFPDGVARPAEWPHVVVVGVSPPVVAEFAAKWPATVAENSVKVTVTLTRLAGDTGGYTVTADPPFATPTPVPIPAGTPFDLMLPVAAGTPAGPAQVVLQLTGPGGVPAGAAVGWVTVAAKK